METTEWHDPDSLLAPLVIGAHKTQATDDPAHYVYGALQAARGCLPETGTATKAAFRKERPLVRKAMYLSGDNAKPYRATVNLVQVPDNATGSVAFGHVLWTAGLYALKDGSATPAIPADVKTFVLEISLTKVAGGYISGGLHLALLRHLWVEFMRAHNPELIVLGGQTRFEDGWWRPSVQSVKAAAKSAASDA
jgi:hypothetical protein